MSDRDDSPVGDDSDHLSLEEKSPSREASPSGQDDDDEEIIEHVSPSKSLSHSRSPSVHRKRHSYSRSRSHSRGRKYRHYSRSKSRSPRRHRRYSRSRSCSYSPRRSYSPHYSPRNSYYGGGDKYYRDYYRDRYSGRGYARSPENRRQLGNRENPEPSRCLGVFGLSLYTQERELREVFGKYGPIEDVQVVYDAQTGRSRGFAFVYYEEVNDAEAAKDKCNGIEIEGRKIRVDFSITRRAHTPTPGIYMGKPTYPRYNRDRRNGGYYRNRGHSPSPYYRHHYSRSRSRSYSPRKYGYY